MEWKRARSDEQKEARISEIVDATARLYETLSFEEITFVSIAKEAKFTRSNLYKYFKSKEEIFLEFLKHDIILWRKDLVNSFKNNEVYSVEEFASIWATLQVKHKRLLNLVSILYTFLEKNTSVQSLVNFKRRAKDELNYLSELLCRLFPSLTPEKALEFINVELATAIGLYQMTNLSEVQTEVLKDPEFKNFKVDFNSTYQKAIEYLIQGLLR
jgi:AcrR family transcriptional regulator